MIHSAIALQKAVYEALTASVDLVSTLGGPHIHDDVPRGKKPPYIAFGKSVHVEIPDSGGEAAEHALTLSIWNRKGGRKPLFEIVHLVSEALTALPDEFDNHVNVNFALESTEVFWTSDAEYLRADMNFRAVTEPLTLN